MYTVVPDGGYTGVATVNSSTGAVSYTGAGWAQISSTYSTLPAVTTYVHAYSGSVTFNGFRRDGSTGSFVKRNSFVPISGWGLDCLYSTPFQALATRALSFAPLMFDSGYNSCFTSGLGSDVVSPLQTSCPLSPLPTQEQLWKRAWADAWFAKYGTPVNFEKDFTYLDYTLSEGPGPLYNNYNFDRQTCVKNYIANDAADGRTHMTFGHDEINAYAFGSNPNWVEAIGGPNFNQVSVSGGVATFTVLLGTQLALWNQANGTGMNLYLYGTGVNVCLNGWYYVTARSGTPLYTSLTAASSCGNGTYTASTDPALKMHFMDSGSPGSIGTEHACVLPRYAGTGLGGGFEAVFQGWSTVNNGVGNTLADTTLVSIVSDGTTYTIHATGHGWAEGHTIDIVGAGTAALNGLYNIHVVDVNTVTTPGTIGNVASAGTYNGTSNAGSDANLVISYDCGLPSNYPVWLRTLFHAGGNIAVNQPIIGGTYSPATGKAVSNWYDPTVMDGGVHYHAQVEQTPYGEAGSVYLAQQGLQGAGLATRAYQHDLPRKALLEAHGMQALKEHTGYLFDPLQDTPNALYWRPETELTYCAANLTWGVTGFRLYLFQSNNAGQYTTDNGKLAWGNSIGPENAKMWAGQARCFQMAGHLTQYLIQPHADVPYFGLMEPNALQTTSSYGNLLMIPCLLDGGITESKTIDLTGIRLAGGSIYRVSLSGYRTIYTPLAGNPTSDTYNHCSAGAGETLTYIAQPSGAVPDLVPTTLTPPATLPYGASHYAIRYGYYPRDMNDDPVQACDTPCTINLMRTGGPTWLQILYLDANHLPLAMGDPTMLPALN